MDLGLGVLVPTWSDPHRHSRPDPNVEKRRVGLPAVIYVDCTFTHRVAQILNACLDHHHPQPTYHFHPIAPKKLVTATRRCFSYFP